MDTIQDKEGLNLPLVEQFFTLQGEGFHTGKAAWFIRIGGCDIGCSWCDTRFSWNPSLHPLVPVEKIIEEARGSGSKSVVITGGEPLMWNMGPLTEGLKKEGIMTFIETSGGYPLTGSWDWICLSPKRNMPPSSEICLKADELKVIVENDSDFEWAEKYKELVKKSCELFLQPEWSRYNKMVPAIVDYIMRNQEWKISIQAHKFLHIP
jgi:organic radical activating enzyme